jgi:uncharacterized membrane protein YuzA (DUF378 family)
MSKRANGFKDEKIIQWNEINVQFSIFNHCSQQSSISNQQFASSLPLQAISFSHPLLTTYYPLITDFHQAEHKMAEYGYSKRDTDYTKCTTHAGIASWKANSFAGELNSYTIGITYSIFLFLHMSKESCGPLGMLSCILMTVGGLNWGLVGIGGFMGANYNVVNLLLGSWPQVEWVVYILVGLAAVHGLTMYGKCNK